MIGLVNAVVVVVVVVVIIIIISVRDGVRSVRIALFCMKIVGVGLIKKSYSLGSIVAHCGTMLFS